jgi:hypothetical protein
LNAADEVDVDDFAEQLVLVNISGGADADDAGVGQHNVQPTELGHTVV